MITGFLSVTIKLHGNQLKRDRVVCNEACACFDLSPTPMTFIKLMRSDVLIVCGDDFILFLWQC